MIIFDEADDIIKDIPFCFDEMMQDFCLAGPSFGCRMEMMKGRRQACSAQ